MSTPERRSIARNRRARHDYEILDRLEAGVVLQGSEVKALRAGRANLIDSHVRIERNEAWLVGTHIGPYENASIEPRTNESRVANGKKSEAASPHFFTGDR